MIEDELREAFARHEAQAPALGPLRRAIDGLAARRRRRRAVTRTGAAAVAVALALALPVQLWRGQFEVPLPLGVGASDTVAPSGPLNLLLLGLDRRGTMRDSRADTIMLIHLPADGSQAYLVSFVRDLATDLPGFGKIKINGAYTLGGVEAARNAVQRLTGIRADAVAEVEFDALRGVADALGGLPVCLPQRITSQHTGAVFPTGCRDYTGTQVADLMRQRRDLPHGAYDRDRIGQRVLLGLAAKAGSRSLLSDFGLVSQLARTPGITLHAGDLSLLGLAMRLNRAEAGDIVGISQPTYNGTKIGGVFYEQLDPAVAPRLFQALRDDTMGAFAQAHPDWVLQE
ncbi:LCP family protein [Catellatospora methionotrophica]|uniref:LCP family protein n=1 Tax=Catellatospora methionotrophica TaxID=121620 RepID=UPI0033E984BE